MLQSTQFSGAGQYEQIARELVRALRGRHSRAELSRRLGYESNVVRRWEAGKSWPTAAKFIEAHQKLNPRATPCFEAWFGLKPRWFNAQTSGREQVAAFLSDIKGKAPVVNLARVAGFNRYSTARWLSGAAEPRLPEFLAVIDAATRRLSDWIATLTDPERLPTLVGPWRQLQLARTAAYDEPWTHAVLRALELAELPKGKARQQAWIVERLGIDLERVQRALGILEQSGQVRVLRSGYRHNSAMAIHTGTDPLRAPLVKAVWARTAIERLEAGSKGTFGYSLFAVSRADLVKLRGLHLTYVRAMQRVIAESTPSECVGLYCSQLLDLSPVDNALG